MTLRPDQNYRRYLSAALLLTLVGLLMIAASATIGGFIERRSEIAELSSQISQLVDRAQAVRRQNAVVGNDTPDVKANLFSVSSEAAASHIQATLRTLGPVLGSSDIQIEQVRALPSLDEGYGVASRVSASISLPGSLLLDAVNALEAATPPIMIETIRIVSRFDGGASRRAAGSNTAQGARADVAVTLRTYASASGGNAGRSEAGARPSRREIGIR